jgi:integrase/recombinase XerD
MKEKQSEPEVLLAPLLQNYFCSHLIGQRDLSRRTIHSYRDTFRLLLKFLTHRFKLMPEALRMSDLDPPKVLAFLEDLEQSRGNSVRTRNARLVAIHSFMRYVASAEPPLLNVAQRILVIPAKRFDRPSIGHLTREQMQAILDAPDAATRGGQRDRLLLLLLYNTGARVSEVAALRVQDVRLDSQATVQLRGKGRKNRAVPLWRSTTRLLRQWFKDTGAAPESPLFSNAQGEPMSRHGIAQRLATAVARASKKLSGLGNIRVTPHKIRHTTAMHLLQSGVDLSVIAMWLGHEHIETTHQYLDADLDSKKQALACLDSPRVPRHRRSAPKPLLQFLEGL